jgi:hypothetical protein
MVYLGEQVVELLTINIKRKKKILMIPFRIKLECLERFVKI